jgi:hypothetical protein
MPWLVKMARFRPASALLPRRLPRLGARGRFGAAYGRERGASPPLRAEASAEERFFSRVRTKGYSLCFKRSSSERSFFVLNDLCSKCRSLHSKRPLFEMLFDSF